MLDLLLKRYGIKEEERDSFLNPDYSRLYDPLLLPDMEKARDRIISAINNSEKIVVFSDYDADGIPGAVVLSDFFKRIGYLNVSFYIPHRHEEGFGLNKEFINECEGSLVITIDCGTADNEEIALANEKGIDVIVTDHHESSALPEAYAVVNHKRADSIYPSPYLCGSGVVYKLVQAVLSKESFGLKEGIEKWSLDMVGIATLSDMVPLVGENRILARFGLDVLRKSKRAGLLSLFSKINLNQKYLTEDDIAFMITPRINAASRMGVPEDAFKLLSTSDEVEANVLADHLEKINQERKGVVASIVKAAKSELKKRESVKDVIVIGNPDWKPALLGLVANSLVEEYLRPVFVWGRDGGNVLKGSCRTYNGYDLYQLMDSVKDSFIEFGGHKGAGGFTVTLENLMMLEVRLSMALISHLEVELPSNKHSPIPLSIDEINENLWQTISFFAPFGTGIEKPVFKIVNAPIRSIRQFGKANEHLELTLGSGIKAISFFSSLSTYSLLPSSTSCTLHANLEKSYFRSRPELRLRIVDIEL